MSYADATAFAASLAATLMVSIVVFQAGDGTHAACPAAEFDGEVVDICVRNGEVVEFGQTLFKLC